ncbi:MAG: parallel beta-helix domain-containing protein [Planctomycetaceae bacterium]
MMISTFNICPVHTPTSRPSCGNRCSRCRCKVPAIARWIIAAALFLFAAVPAIAFEIRTFSPSPDVQYQLQEAIINASPGDIIELSAGVFHLTTEINVATSQLTIRGAGRDKTMLNFRNQSAGGSGIVATGDEFVIEDLAVEDTVGNAIKVQGANSVTFRNLRVEWTRGPNSENGAYGIYPVECQNVLIDGCVAIAASDAGIYVGQSTDVIVRNCEARQNVAGIEIENTIRADVYDNVAHDNTGGIMVFDLPGLQQTNGHHVRVYRNKVEDNNHVNFAPKGTIVSEVPSGTGLMLMAMDDVEVFENSIAGNQTANLLLCSFLITERKITDAEYDAYPERISIHHNTFSKGGLKPAGTIAALLLPVLGQNFPDILFDGVPKPNTAAAEDSTRHTISLHDNGDASFANLNLHLLTAGNVLTGKYRMERDASLFTMPMKELEPVELKPLAVDATKISAAAEVYRRVPRTLSEWKLFALTDGRMVPASDLLPYELNTPLFSDETTKYRLIRLPENSSTEWNATESLSFPVGTVIAKTFAHPDQSSDATPSERWIETRVQFLESTGWYGVSYVWNEKQSDAELRLGGAAIDLEWTTSSGRPVKTEYQIPNANQCLSCHSANGQYVPIGTTARNLNRKRVESDGLSQLEQWASHGLLKNCPSTNDIPKLAQWDHPDEFSVESRARAWLEVNCAHCHNPSGTARTTGLDLRTSQTNPGKLGVFKSPVATGKGSGGRKYDIVPGKPAESILVYRLETDLPGARMPSLGRSIRHEESLELIRQWINELPPEKSRK